MGGALYQTIKEPYTEGANALPQMHRDEIYGKMRSGGGFIVNNDDEAAVYVERVAKRHCEKFQALYHRFSQTMVPFLKVMSHLLYGVWRWIRFVCFL